MMAPVELRSWRRLCLVSIVLLAGCAPATPPSQSISSGCAATGGLGSVAASDVALDLSSARNPVQPVRMRVGQVLLMGGLPQCLPWSFTPAADVAPILEQINRHTTAAGDPFGQGDLDVEYRSVRTGTARIDLCLRICSPGFARTAVITVIPVESPAQAALRGTGTIALTAPALAGVHPLRVTCQPRLVVDGQYAPVIPLFSFTVGGIAYHGGSVGPRFGADVIFGTDLSHEYRTAAPGTLTLDDAGGSISDAPLKTVDPADIDVLRLDAGTMSLAWHC
jgi:hypothetical protein